MWLNSQKGIGNVFCIEFQNIKVCNNNGVLKYEDFQGDFFTFKDGHRITLGASKADKRIFLIGPCTIMGAYVGDEQTIVSYLQSELYRNHYGDYEVVNWGTCGLDYELQYPLTEEIRKEDIVVIGFTDEIWESILKREMQKNEKVRYWGRWSDIFREIEHPIDCVLDTCRHVNY